MSSVASGPGTSGGEETLLKIAAGAQALIVKPWFAPAVNIGALLLLTAGMASWIWAIFKPSVPQKVPEMATMAVPSTVHFDPHSVTGANIFGRAEPKPGQVSLDSIPISSLNLVLTGVVAAGGSSYALISVNGQPQEPFAIGQEVLNGAILQAVYPDRVILERGGIQESLMLEGMAKILPELGLDGLPAQRASSPAQANAGASPIQQQGPNSYVVPRSVVDAQMKQPQEFLSQALMVPNASGGFLVREIQPGSIYENIGLQVGDVIRSVNGQPVNNVEDAVRAYQRFGKMQDIRVEVVRSGRPELLQYNIR